MGNFEKLVVLTVLFLSAIVLAVSLNDDGEAAEKQSPLSAAKAQLEERGIDTGTPAANGAESFLLSTEVEHTPEPRTTPAEPVVIRSRGTETPATEEPKTAAPRRDADGKLRILRNEEGLAGAGIEDYRVYAVRDGDTWSGLSERFYEGGRYVHLLRSANEEVTELRAGDRILVPVYDFAQEAGQRDPYVTRGEGQVATPVAASSTAAPAVVDANYASARTYTVRPGDSLTKISHTVYGTAARWEAIFAANRGKLESPDWLQVGMELAIPRGSELDAMVEAAKAEASSAEATGTEKDSPKVR